MADPSTTNDDGEELIVADDPEQEADAGDEVDGFMLMGGNLLSAQPAYRKLPPEKQKSIAQ